MCGRSSARSGVQRIGYSGDRYVAVVRFPLDERKSPFAPDKRHLHHKLLTIYNGVHKKATFTILGLNLLFMAFAYIGRDWRNEILVGGDIVLFAVMFYIVDRLAKRKLAQKAAK